MSSSSFIRRTQELALHPDTVTDPNAEVWSGRAFSVIAILGDALDKHRHSNEDMPEDVLEIIVESLVQTLAKAPTTVVARGTLHSIMTAASPDDLPSDPTL